MYQYRVFVKDCLNLGGLVKSNINCLSFQIKRDLLEKATSTFNLEYIDPNIDIGDVLGLYDMYGTNYFIGVIEEIDVESNQITCTSNISYFNYQWLYNPLREESGSTEELIKKEFENTFLNANDYLMRTKYGNIQISTVTTEKSLLLPLKDDNTVESFEDFIYDCYSNFDIICDFKAYFEQIPPTLTIDASAINRDPIKIGNNFNAIQNFRINTDTFENNKLIIYNGDGTQLRGVYYGSTGGITQDDESPLRLKKINNVIQFSDDEIDLILAQNLQNNMYNHKITFDLVLDNQLYDFFDLFKLGCPVEIYYNGIYYNTIFTGYEYIKEENQRVSSVSITCGKVRNSLTSKILRYVK